MLRLVWLLPIVLAAACRREPEPAPSPPEPSHASPAGPADARTTEAVIDRAAAWLAAFPADHLRFDAAIGLAAIRARTDSDALRAASARAREVSDRDTDNPLRRGYDDAARVAPAVSAGWPLPKPGEPRANVNRVVAEAMHCKENGIRRETLAYIAGPMRDEGGYQTTHALWALAIARDHGCLTDFAERARPLIAELREHQTAPPATSVSAIDLYAERLLMIELAGEQGADIEAWRRRLIELQAEDGGFGELAPDQDSYLRYHATLVAAWALAVHP
ncbi:MAG TPA: hypothetical protein VLB44_18400 [Kofleriaceae bacterium]|nr:hypothetical protein [Kofleriaceae bacterium]